MAALSHLMAYEVWVGLCVFLAILELFLGWRLYRINRVRRKQAAFVWSLMDALPFPVWRRDSSTRIVGANQAYLDVIQAASPAVLEQQLELGGRYYREDRLAMARRVLKTGMTLSESQYVVIDGARRLLEVTEAPLSDDAGGSLAFALDRTSLEAMQSDLSQHVSAHGEVLEVLHAGIAIFGGDHRLRFFNTAFVELWCIESQDLAGEPTLNEVLDLLQDRRRLPEQVDFRAYKDKQIQLFTSLLEAEEGLMHLPDNRTIRFIVSPHPSGGLLFVYEDVTDRMTLERSYNTLIDVQRATLDNLRQAVAVFGGDGCLRLWNPLFERLWSYPAALLDSSPHISDLVDNIMGALALPRSAQQSVPPSRESFIIQVTNPQVMSGQIELLDSRVLDYGIVPMPDGGCMVTYLDVTDTTRVQRALEERAIALENADRVKTEFIANISYELRTPLNAIIGFTEVLNLQIAGDLNDRQRDYVAYVMSASNQLLTLINDILDLATIDAGYLELKREEVALREMLEGLVTVMSDRAQKGGVDVMLECPIDIGILNADATRLRQAIFNLMSNAVKFTPDGGKVTLSAVRDDGVIAIVVTDTGIGFDLVNNERLFDKFEVGDTTARESGPGLGLALTKSLIELHGGSVDLKSEINVGTTATCRLPIVPAVPKEGLSHTL
jgi:signal transduction histidine kinase